MASPATGAVLGGKPSCWHSGSPRGMCCRAANWVAISGAAQSLMAEAEPCVRSAAASPLAAGEGRRARSTPGAASSTATRLQGCACPPARGVCVLSVCLAERCSPCRAEPCAAGPFGDTLWHWGSALGAGGCGFPWHHRLPQQSQALQIPQVFTLCVCFLQCGLRCRHPAMHDTSHSITSSLAGSHGSHPPCPTRGTRPDKSLRG